MTSQFCGGAGDSQLWEVAALIMPPKAQLMDMEAWQALVH